MNKGALMSSQYEAAEEICEKDWRKVEQDTTLDPEICRYPEILSGNFPCQYILEIDALGF